MMSFKRAVYFHPKERKSAVLLVVLGMALCFAQDVVIDWMASEPEVAFHRLVVEPEYFAGCYEANDLSEGDLYEFGLDSSLVERWINFRNTIGGFEDMSQVRRIFGMPEAVANRLEPVLQFDKPLEGQSSGPKVASARLTSTRQPEVLQEKDKASPAKGLDVEERDTVKPFCLNSADENTLRQIRGIGAVFASRILSYRDLLGGYYSIEQLEEVYGMDPSLVRRNSHLFLIDTTFLKTIDWQDEDFGKILSHPYLDYEDVQCIFQLRRQDDTGTEDLKSCFSESQWERLKLYFRRDISPEQ